MAGAAGSTPPVDPARGVRPEPVGRSRPDRRREAPPRPARSDPPAVEEEPSTRPRGRIDIVV
jgi:hypothetical protein